MTGGRELPPSQRPACPLPRNPHRWLSHRNRSLSSSSTNVTGPVMSLFQTLPCRLAVGIKPSSIRGLLCPLPLFESSHPPSAHSTPAKLPLLQFLDTSPSPASEPLPEQPLPCKVSSSPPFTWLIASHPSGSSFNVTALVFFPGLYSSLAPILFFRVHLTLCSGLFLVSEFPRQRTTPGEWNCTNCEH